MLNIVKDALMPRCHNNHCVSLNTKPLNSPAWRRTDGITLTVNGVFGTASYPNVIEAVIIDGLGLWGGWQIISQAQDELTIGSTTPAVIEGSGNYGRAQPSSSP